MNRLLLVAALVILSGLGPWRLASHATPATVPPPMPASFYGTVTQNGDDAVAGTQVSAWINSVRYATTNAFTYDGHTMYALDVPADDPASPEVDGGRPGDTIVFHIGGLLANQTALWRGGTNTSLNLTALRWRIFLPLLAKIRFIPNSMLCSCMGEQP